MTLATKNHNKESGMILVNVLAVLALASTVVFMMITLAESAIRRSQRFSEAAQAAAYALGGETSAIVALRRDGVVAPYSDNLREPWAALAENAIPITNGSFSLAIADAQARFNVNTVVHGGTVAEEQLRDIAAAVELPPAIANLIIARLEASGPVARLEALDDAGIASSDLLRLSRLVTALPGSTAVNINTADERLIAIMLGNKVGARLLTEKRNRQGYLTTKDISDARVVLPPGLGFTSNHFLVSTEVKIADTTQYLVTLLERRVRDRRVEVVAIERKREMRAPEPALPFLSSDVR